MNRLAPPVNWEFRLPSNVEWEYAARAGAKGLLPAELQRDSLYGLVVALSRSAWVEMPESIGTVPVGSKNSNKWGLCDILGNVWEWCEESGMPVLRGGSWSIRSTECHLASEMRRKADFKNNTTGFRLVLAPSG
jgi:formylglycine-generating enzyme required for sulfatase activity